jgi:hypothetical protein
MLTMKGMIWSSVTNVHTCLGVMREICNPVIFADCVLLTNLVNFSEQSSLPL